MNITFTYHALKRLDQRGFTKETIEDVVNNPNNLYLDRIQKSNVAIAVKKYRTKERLVSFFYHIENQTKVVHSFHIESKNSIRNRLLTGRYVTIK